jgi:tetratricopeptide (TPR) repeat protein
MNGSRDDTPGKPLTDQASEPSPEPGELPQLAQELEPEDSEDYRRDTDPDISIKIDLDGSPADESGVRQALEEMPKDTIPAAAEEYDPRLGTMINERYLLLASLGEGGMGTVYHARHVLMDKPVAIKLIHAELAHIEDVTKRFEREARSSSRLSDPHCITVTDFGTAEDGSLYLVMELLHGESLADLIDREGALPIPETLRITSQILKALSHAHGQGVVHRDLKPENVMLVTHGDEKNFVKILDFGIAKLMSGGAGESLTRSGVVFGTPKYLSPEQALGDDVDHRADLYALGIILYEMLFGEPPYSADSAMDTLSLHLTADIPCLADRGKFPRGLQEVVDRALAKKPAERYADADEFLAAVEAVDPEGAPPSTTTVVIEKLAGRGAGVAGRRRPKRWPWILFGFILAIGAVAGAAYFFKRDVKQVAPEKILSKGEAVGLGIDAAKVEGLLKKAEGQISEGLSAEAVISAKEALRIDPELAPAALLLGHAQFLSGERAEAMVSYEQALTKKPELRDDVRFLEHLRQGLEWEISRDQAAVLLGRHGGEAGVQMLADKANSALTPIEVRKVSRKGLVATDHSEAVDWLTSLTADFNDVKKCREKIEVIEEMERTGDRRFLQLLEAHRPITRKTGWFKKKTMNACIGAAVMKAIEILSAIEETPDTATEEAAPQAADAGQAGTASDAGADTR